MLAGCVWVQSFAPGLIINVGALSRSCGSSVVFYVGRFSSC